jgi:hypothetical protein
VIDRLKYCCLLAVSLTIIAGVTQGRAETHSDSGPSMKPSPLTCHLKIDSSEITDEPVIVLFELHNQGGKELEILRYFTPIEGILGAIFQVDFRGQALEYRGPMVKRRAPGEHDWLTLAPGVSHAASNEIGAAWDVGKPGKYSLQLVHDIQYRSAGNNEPLYVPAKDCGTINFSVTN